TATTDSHDHGHGSALRRVEAALLAAECDRGGRGQWECPAHDDRTPSLAVTQGRVGVLLYCFAGCEVGAIAAALGLSMGVLFDEPRRERPEEPRGQQARANGSAQPQRICEYEYVDRNGELLARKVRYEPGKDGRDKSFEWEVPDGAGGWRLARKGE